MQSGGKKMKKFLGLLLGAALVFGVVGIASATSITFSFGGVEDTGSDGEISDYMTDVYGSKITVDDAEVRDNEDGDSPEWVGKGDNNNFLRVRVGTGDMEILFVNVPIIALSGDTQGYVFTESGATDFEIRAYDSTWSDFGGTFENPFGGALVDVWTWSSGTDVGPDGVEINIPDIIFDDPIYLLVFGDGGHPGSSGSEYIAIDKLTVESMDIPEPTTLLLLGTGLIGLAGLSRRKFFKK
jgi:hypothetical protein